MLSPGARAAMSRPVDIRLLLRALEWATLGLAAGFYALFIARTSFHIGRERYFSLFDDAMISMRYARNLADGTGLVWNPGEAVEGYTNFLWTAWMALLHVVGLPESKVSLAVMVCGAMLLVGNALVVRAIARRLAPGCPWVVLLAFALVALYYPLAYWTLRGTEVGLLAFVTSTGILLALRLRDGMRRQDVALLAALLAVGLLTRTDFAVTALVLAGFVALSHYRVASLLAGVIAGTLVAHTAFRLAVYGVPLPNTYYLKVEGVSLATRLARGARALEVVELAHLFAPTLLAGGFLVACRRRAGAGAWLLAAVFLAQTAYSLCVGGDAWEYMEYSNRYLAQALPGLLVLAALGLEAAVRAGRLAAALAAGFGVVWLVLELVKAPIDRLQPNVTKTYEPRALALALALVFALLALPALRRHTSPTGARSTCSARATP